MSVMTGSRYLSEITRAYGVTHVFFTPTILTSALAEMDRLHIVGVMTHGEKAAAYMADGYARVSRRPGICLAQTIGTANLAAGLRDARLACSPVIAITGGPTSEGSHRHVYQQTEDYQLFEPLCKFNARISVVERMPDLLRQAFRAATTGCSAPVHLEIAGHLGEIAEQQADLELIVEDAFTRCPAIRPYAEPQRVIQVADLLKSAERPVIVAGGGVTWSSAQPEVLELSRTLNIPVATALNAKGTIPEDDELSVGVLGLYSRACANRVVTAADLVFFIGSHTGSQVTNNWHVPRKGTRVIQLDINPEELGRHYPNVASLCGDARSVLRQLLNAFNTSHTPPPRHEWLRQVREMVSQWRTENESLRNSDAVPMRPERLCKEIEQVLPADAVLVSDTGHAGMWSAIYIEITHPSQTYLRAAGSLGWALPAALGAKCASPDRPVICFTGDGGFYYHIAELETAARYGINVTFVVNDNHSLNQETEIFNAAYGGQQNSGFKMWQFQKLNLAEIAEAMGCVGIRVERPEQIKPALEKALRSDRPTVVDLVSDIKALAPGPWS